MNRKNTGVNDINELIDSAVASSGNLLGLHELMAYLMNAIMKKERDLQLRKDDDNKANGYYDRTLSSAMGNISLSVPRDRNGDFRPYILPSEWKRSDKSYDNLLVSLVLNSYSPNRIKMLFKHLNLPYSQTEVDELRKELYQKAKIFKTRQLPENIFAVLIDAYNTDAKDDIDNQVKKAVIYTVLGITLQGKKEVLGYYEFFGNENKGDWLSIFNDLIKRGLRRTLLVVSDDFPGISHAISALFPNSDHQLCFVHLQRNIHKNLSKDDFEFVKKELAIMSKTGDFSSAVVRFTDACNKLKDKYPSFIDYLLKNKERYFAFLKYPEKARKNIYTTNAVENINSRLEVIRYNNGGYFQSTQTMVIAAYVLFQNITNSKWKKSVFAFKEVEYEITQMFNARFLTQTQSS